MQGINPKLVVVLIGANNVSLDESGAKITLSIQQIVDVIGARLIGARILLLGILPVGKNHTRRREIIKDVNRRLSKIPGVFFLDIGHNYLNEDGTISSKAMPDYLHLSKHDYTIFANAIKPYIVTLFLSYTRITDALC